jgi:hypothetical protein
MLLPLKVAQGVRDGSVTLAYRRWKKQDVVPGRRFTTAAGVVRVEAVDVVDADAITDEDARQAGWPDADRLRKRLAPDESLPTYRVRLVWDGEDPRIALREDAALTVADVAAIDARLERLDRASPSGPWTMATLALIGEHPQRRAPDLAEMVGRETAPFKLDVRKLKAMGLTRSFAVGYEISPRGRAYLDRTTRSA